MQEKDTFKGSTIGGQGSAYLPATKKNFLWAGRLFGLYPFMLQLATFFVGAKQASCTKSSCFAGRTLAMATSASASALFCCTTPPTLPSMMRPPPRPLLRPLSAAQIATLLPYAASSALAARQFGHPMDWSVRLTLSFTSAVCVFSFSNTLALLLSLFWLWGPALSAAFLSSQLRLRFPYAGVWRARVLALTPISRPFSPRSDTSLQELFQNLSPAPSALCVVIGDDSPARLQMEVPISDDYAMVEVGEPAEVLVLSDRPNLSRFKAMRDVYLPRIGVWISQNPCVERAPFEALSLSSSRRRAIGDSQDSWRKEGASSSLWKASKDKRPLLNAVNSQNPWLLSEEPRHWKTSDELDWDSPVEREKDQQPNSSSRWKMLSDE